MADNFTNLNEIRDYQKLLKEIKEEEAKILADRRRYNKEGNLSKKAQAEVLKLIADQQVAEKEISRLKKERDEASKKSSREQNKASKEQINFAKSLTGLAKKSNKLAKSKQGIILQSFGLEAKNTKFIDAAKKATTAKEKTAYKELEQIRLDSLDELSQDTFDLNIFKSKLADIDLPDELKDSLTSKFSSAADDSDAIRKAMDMDLPFLNALDALQSGIDGFTSVLMNTKLLAMAVAGFLVKAIIDFGKAVIEVRNELGLSAKNALELSVNMKQASVGAKLVGGDTEKAESAIKAFAETTGRVNKLSGKTATQFGMMSSTIGASAESMGTLLKFTMMANDGSQEKALADLKSVEAIAKSENLLGSQVFDDVADAAKTQATFFGKSVVEIAKATKEMRKLGIETSALNDIAESLLDLESSLSSEFELQLLFGKNINLQKARELAFARDNEGLAKEVKRLFGDQFDLSTMNAAQAKALQQSLNLSQEQMTNLVKGTGEFGDKAKESSKIMQFLKNNAVALGVIIGGVVGLMISGAVAIRAAFTAGFSLLADVPKMAGNFGMMAAGTATGAAIGGGLGYALKKEKMEDASIQRESVGSMEPAATFSLGDAASINVSKETQQSINLQMDKVVNVIREELVTEVKRGLKDVAMKVTEVKGSTEKNTSAVKGLAI